MAVDDDLGVQAADLELLGELLDLQCSAFKSIPFLSFYVTKRKLCGATRSMIYKRHSDTHITYLEKGSLILKIVKFDEMD